jgi:outer membrane lipoprotein carrier protein
MTVALLVLWATAAGADQLGEALKRLQDRYDDTKTFRAEFRKVAFEKPNRMRWDYEPPDRQTIVGDGQTLWLYQPDQQQVIKAPLSQAFEASTPVTFLSGLGHLDREFQATLDKDEPERWVLKLVPRKERQIGTLMLSVRKTDASVEEAKVTDTLGTVTKIHFTGEQRNVPIEPALFRFTPPPGVDVVKPPTS